MLDFVGIAVPCFVTLAFLFFFLAFLPLRLSGWSMSECKMTAGVFIPE